MQQVRFLYLPSHADLLPDLASCFALSYIIISNQVSLTRRPDFLALCQTKISKIRPYVPGIYGEMVDFSKADKMRITCGKGDKPNTNNGF